MEKTLLVISGGIESIPGIKKAKELGLNLIISDGDKNAPGFEFADEIIVKSTYDVDGTLDMVKKINKNYPINGVISFSADVPLTVATIAKELKLLGIPITTAKLCSNKLEMKKKLLQHHILVPWFSSVKSITELKNFAKNHKDLVIKPVDSRGSRGVLKINKDSNLKWAFNYAKNISPSNQVMVEEYLEGSQYSTESIIIEGRCSTPGFSERNYELMEQFRPFFIENGGQQPPSLSKNYSQQIKKTAENAALTLGITNGTAKGDIVLTAKGPIVIEIAPRLSGGWFSSHQIPLNSGIDMLNVAIKLCLGEKVSSKELQPSKNVGVAIRYFFPEPGKIISIKNIEKTKKYPWVHRLQFFVGVGDLVSKQTDHTKRCGYVITTGKNTKEAIIRAEQIITEIKIITH